MPVKSKVVYDPSLSVKENAEKCGVKESTMRYYIRTRGIDRRYHGKVNVVEELKAYLKERPNATRAELSRETGHGINTIRRYWEIAHGNGMLMPNEDKTNHLEERRIKRLHKKHIAYLDKLPIEFICEYLKERKSKKRKEQIRKEQEEKKKPVINELKDKIDALLEVECENTRRLEQNPSYLPTPTKQDLYKREKEVYNVAEHYCVAFRSKNDLWKGMRIPFGNMNGGYPYKMHGVEFPTSEHAYIFGLFSNNTPEHIAIQRELLSEPNGYNAKKIVRKNNRRQHRADWWGFNLEWMLYCVWEKANQCSEFRELLMAIPEGATIIEDGSFQKVNKSFDGVSYWGARNPEKRAFGKLAREYAKSLELNTQKATDEVEDKLLWDYCNVGTYTGNNIMGKILTMVKQCLHDGTQPDIDYELLKSKNIYFLGNLIGFDSTVTYR